MEFKYPEGLKFKIVSVDVPFKWKFPKAGSCMNACEWKGYLQIGEEAELRHKRNSDKRFQYYLSFDSNLESDFLSEQEIEILMGKEFIDEYNNNKNQEGHAIKSKPPLGVMSRDIYEYKRIQDLARAIHEYIDFGSRGSRDYDLLIGLTDELLDRLYELKEANNNV